MKGHSMDKVSEAVAAERERCAVIALEQHCERGTPWDRACVTIADAIRAAPKTTPPAHDDLTALFEGDQ